MIALLLLQSINHYRKKIENIKISRFYKDMLEADNISQILTEKLKQRNIGTETKAFTLQNKALSTNHRLSNTHNLTKLTYYDHLLTTKQSTQNIKAIVDSTSASGIPLVQTSDQFHIQTI